jgi:D-alanyl-D-alanine carboxypeptidase
MMSLKRAQLLLLGLLSLFCLGFGPPRLADSDVANQPFAPHQIVAMRKSDPPETSATATLLVSLGTGRILHAVNAQQRHAPASLTKIVTALVALQRGRQDQEMTVTQADRRVYSAIHLFTGEELNLRQLLFAMLIESDNAASHTIARTLGGGSIATFVGWMNELVAGWNLRDTHFANPSGLDDENNYSTAFEMAIIARQAMQDPIFAEIVGHYQWIVAGRVVTSTNELLNTYPGTIGVKTGTTDLAGECLIAVVDRPTGEAMSVVLGSVDRFRDSRLLLDYFYTNYREFEIDVPDTMQNRYRDETGTFHHVAIKEPMTYLLKPWEADSMSIYRRIDDLSPTPDPEKPVGVLEVRLAGQRYDEVPLYVR